MDVVELNLLSGLQNKRTLMARMEAQQASGMQALASRSNQMSTAATATNGQPTPDASDAATLGGGPGALVNRSPTTNYHYYQQPAQVASPTPTPAPTPAPTPSTASSLSPWLLAIPLALAAGGAAYYFWPKMPATQPEPTWQGQTTIKLGDAP